MTNITPSVFKDTDGFFTDYAVELQLREKLMAGVPKDPKIIEGWLRAKAGVTADEEVRTMMVRTLIELGADLDPGETSMDKIMKASEEVASSSHTNGFKCNGEGPYIEGRQVKAMLRETVNAVFAGAVSTDPETGKTKRAGWGPTNKGPKSFFVEHVFVQEDAIHLGVAEPSGIDLVIGHISGAGGKRATLAYVEYVLQPTLLLTVRCDEVAQKAISEEQWRKIWLHAQENGLGAMRSQGHGRFNVTRWERLPASVPKKQKRTTSKRTRRVA